MVGRIMLGAGVLAAFPFISAAYEGFACEVVPRCHEHPAWPGLIVVWGNSSDVFGEHPFHAPQIPENVTLTPISSPICLIVRAAPASGRAN